MIALVLALPAGTVPATATGHMHLPAPITVQTSAATFEIGQDGHVVRSRPRVLASPRDAAVFPSGVWYVLRHRHLVVGRGARTLWRSHRTFPSTFQIGVVTIAARTVAFSYRRGGREDLYVAPLGRHPERRIARGEFPLGPTSDGFFTYRYRGHELLVRGDTGALLATIVTAARNYEYDSTSETLYFIAHGQLIGANGTSTGALGSLRALGLRTRPAPALIPASGLIELIGNNRLVLLKPDGARFAQARLTTASENLSSSIAIAPDATAVAYTVLDGNNPATGVETVYLLRAGAHTATALYRRRIQITCERGAAVQWHGRWLLYATSEGNLAVLDSTGRQHAIELSPIVRSLPGHPQGISAYWTGQAPAL